ncbi:hypothetical protein [uncultured Cohaesibacter sp.]|uniref:hypothetical protein n=1 Tax=uncultured Cohaesibacter sp. TaxID=1002546 RepID=UPI0029C983C3|nr:hypothetical protein [uncultured Cohaesibacter sp.]
MPDKQKTETNLVQLQTDLSDVRARVCAMNNSYAVYLLDLALEELAHSYAHTRCQNLSGKPTIQDLARYRKLLATLNDDEECNDGWWLQKVCERYRVHPSVLFRSPRILREHTEALAVYVYGLITFYEMGIRQAGEILKRDRTTAAHHRNAVVDLRDTDRQLDEWLQGIEDRIYISRNIGPLSKLDKEAQIILLKQQR